MQKISPVVIFLTAFAFPFFFAQAASPELKSYSIKLEHLANRTKGSTEELTWDGLKCQGRYDSLAWMALPEKACRDLATLFENERSALVALQKSPPKQKHPALHQPKGQLLWKDASGNHEWIVNLATAPRCTDADLKHCHDIQLDEPSTLAKKLREILTQTLGRLPLPSSHDGDEQD
jgi:hypothetical protein